MAEASSKMRTALAKEIKALNKQIDAKNSEIKMLKDIIRSTQI